MQITLVQDWFTNLAWDQPQLFYILPCVYNAQTNIQLLRPPWEEGGSITIIAHSIPECGFEGLKCQQASAHIWDLPSC